MLTNLLTESFETCFHSNPQRVSDFALNNLPSITRASAQESLAKRPNQNALWIRTLCWKWVCLL